VFVCLGGWVGEVSTAWVCARAHTFLIAIALRLHCPSTCPRTSEEAQLITHHSLTVNCPLHSLSRSAEQNQRLVACGHHSLTCSAPSLPSLPARITHSLFIAFIAIIAIISTRCHNRQNGLKGALPEAIGNLTKLSVLNLNGGRPDNYMGCSGMLGT